jgi:hypothetical protein
MKENTLNNDEIVDKLLLLLKLENDNQLANYFNVERQQIRQFRNGKRIGLTQMIMTELLDFKRTV